MKKLLPLILCLTVILTSCGNAKSDISSFAATADYDSAYGEAYAAAETPAANNYADLTKSEASATSQKSVKNEINKKIIKNANVDMTAKDVRECYDKILSFISDRDGYEYNKTLSTSGDFITLRAELKVNPAELDNVLTYMYECGEVINSSTSSDDITTQYIDTQIRLDNKKKNLEKYYEYYNKADTLEESMILQDKIDSLTAEIESYEGQLNYWNTLVSESTISLYIQQENDPHEIKKEVEWDALGIKDMGNLIYNGFTSVINGIVSVFQWLIIIIATISPLLLIIAVIIFIIIISRKRKIKKAAAKNSNSTVKEEAKPSVNTEAAQNNQNNDANTENSSQDNGSEQK